jgi:hypothetical protein
MFQQSAFTASSLLSHDLPAADSAQDSIRACVYSIWVLFLMSCRVPVRSGAVLLAILLLGDVCCCQNTQIRSQAPRLPNEPCPLPSPLSSTILSTTESAGLRRHIPVQANSSKQFQTAAAARGVTGAAPEPLWLVDTARICTS